jgi:peptide/nickel transport system ATP-binding protein
MLLSVNNLNISKGNNSADLICKNISFQIDKGETLGILGESGSGKSITALSVLNLLPGGLNISGGEILFTQSNGLVVNLCKLSKIELQKIRGKEIAMVFQEPMTSLNPVYTCGNQIIEMLKVHLSMNQKNAYDYTLELFKKVRLPDPERIFKSYPHQLSGGQKQRVMIAMAISCKPQLLIADEPTTALDVSVQKSILELLKSLQEEMGMSILFISHDISVLSEISHRSVVFFRGDLVEEGFTKNIIKNAQHPYTKGLMSCRLSINNKNERLKTIDDFLNPSLDNTENVTVKPKDVEKFSIFEIKGLEVAFLQPRTGFLKRPSEKKILNNLDLTVFKNETLGIVGESGSGKTTLGRTLLKLINNSSGTIKFHGKDISTLNRDESRLFRQKVQIIFQDPYSSLNPKICIGEAIEEPLRVYKIGKSAKERKEKVMSLLHQVNLTGDIYNRYPHEFSGGQRQRIGIARALAVNPELIILDESVAALDVSVQAQVLNLLNDLKRDFNLTYMFISHDLNVVRYMSDRIIVLNQGTIVEQGNAELIFNNPQNNYTKTLITSTPRIY